MALSSALPGVTIRYSTDGSSLTALSSVYTGPLALTTQTTLQARGFRTGWTESDAAVETYGFADRTPPTITTPYAAPPNAAGWQHTPVTVTFTCTDDNAGVASCQGPLLFDTDGAGQTATVTATDLAGNQAVHTVTTNLDRTPSAVTIIAPTPNSATDQATITVSATVTDALSGVARATCNGVAATLADGEVSCTVALQKGLNLVVVQVSDATCATFFSQAPRTGYFDLLKDALMNQVPNDGPRSTLSWYDAGFLPAEVARSPSNADWVRMAQKVPVCQIFMYTRANAAAQVSGGAQRARNIYVNPRTIGSVTQGTILHETLHNLTGLMDFLAGDRRSGVSPPYDLKTFMGVEPKAGVNPEPDTYSITKAVIDAGCVAR